MDSPSFDLGSLCSSPFLYREGEDFLGQTVNTFFDEDISFDFVDTFEAGFSMTGRTDEVSATATHEKDQYLMRESSLLLTSPQGHDSSSEKELNTTDSTETIFVSRGQRAKLSQRENSAAIQTSISENKNTCTNRVEASPETALSRTVSKNAEERTQNATRQEATETDNVLSTSHDNKDFVETGSQGEKIANIATRAASREDLGNNFQQNTNILSSVHEKTTFDDFKLLSLDEHTACNKERAYAIKGRESPRAADLEKGENNPSFALKNSTFKRCVVPKTFYSPFWKPEKSTARQEKSLEDGFINARRNVDILYCCNCKSQKRAAKKIQITMKPAQSTLTTSHKDSNRYIDFLKRNSVAMRSQGKHREACNKTISGGISRHGYICNEANRNDQWISFPAIDTSFRTTSRQKALSNRDIGSLYSRTVSIAPIDGLIAKYKGRHFDLVEQQKRYQLKPFK